jgi:hypothetical protein
LSAPLEDEGSRLVALDFRHPSQATRVRLALYRQPRGFLVTEERAGSAKVVGTIGVVPSREDADALLAARERQLAAQRYSRVDPAGRVDPAAAR